MSWTKVKESEVHHVWCERPYLSLVCGLQVLCVGRNACYVGETSRHLFTRVGKHLVCGRTSHIFRHRHNSPQFRTFGSDECFNILDHAFRTFQLKIKKAIYIQWEKLTLNHQLYHVNFRSVSIVCFVQSAFRYIVWVQLCTLCYSELKMTEELSKHVLTGFIHFLKIVTYLLLSRHFVQYFDEI